MQLRIHQKAFGGKQNGASTVAHSVKNSPEMQKTWFDPWDGKIPWRRAWQPTPISLPGESERTEEPGGLVHGCEESDATERLSD